jgi:dolichol kinase
MRLETSGRGCGNFLEGGPNLSGLLSAFILSFTVLLVVVIGILAAYGTVIAILRAFASQTQKTGSGKPVLVPAQTRAAHAGGA